MWGNSSRLLLASHVQNRLPISAIVGLDSDKENETVKIDLSGKTAVVSASTAGIGLAVATGLAACGAETVTVPNEQGGTGQVNIFRCY